MYINFHYFAVKVLALEAGFDNDSAQLIAQYSQFVDDFDKDDPIYMKKSSIPDFAMYLTIPQTTPSEYIFFTPVPTGLFGYKVVYLIKEFHQRNVLAPFHFIPNQPFPQNVNDPNIDRLTFCTSPLKMSDTSILKDMLSDAANQYYREKSRRNLIGIGTLLHVFADTYSHQRFSGLSGWENASYLEDVVQNNDEENVTETYYRDSSYHLPSIGHLNSCSAPDRTNVRFTISQSINKDDVKYPFQGTYRRNNTEEFLTASREILNYLRVNCLNKDEISESSWKTLSDNLKECFLQVENEDFIKINDTWKMYFPNIDFQYSKENLMYNSLDGEVQQDFFSFNDCAYKIRERVNGNRQIR